MRVFLVHAHHEPASFNGALTREATASLGAAGHEVVVSDLYAMRFDPVSDRRNFTTVKDPACLKQQNEESYASEHDGYAVELQSEMDKLAWCDALVLQFPLGWLGLPAILKSNFATAPVIPGLDMARYDGLVLKPAFRPESA
jgi:NAD(P)H dehydrogenase (quinone)